MRLVLDTNVWIDWLVYDDPAVAPLKAAHHEGRASIVIDEACLRELQAVLAYPEFRLDAAQKTVHLAEVARCTIRHEHRRLAFAITLPRCSDPDDQKFLELAYDAGADWLFTKDKALLRLGKKQLLASGFRVGTPQQWMNAATT
ncbi:MAG: putative toxin-antitoxin system toxin component, PIN family [Betaproteobacteria bacterium]